MTRSGGRGLRPADGGLEHRAVDDRDGWCPTEVKTTSDAASRVPEVVQGRRGHRAADLVGQGGHQGLGPVRPCGWR